MSESSDEHGGVQCVLCDNTAESPEEHEQHMQELHDDDEDETCPVCGEEYEHKTARYKRDRISLREDRVACRYNDSMNPTAGEEVYVHERD